MMIGVIASILAALHPIDTGSIASNSANYDGSALHLEGEVALEHGFGQMKAEKAILTREIQGQEEFPFSCIELAQKVRLALTTSANVECEKAFLDFTSLRGILTAPEHVHYIDVIKKGNKTVPFELFSPYLDLQMKKSPYDIERARARDGVHLIYDTLYHLKTESILYSKEKADQIFLSSEGSGPCVWSYQNDEIHAEKFHLDLTQNELTLQQASGHLASFSKGQIQFTAGQLHWKHTDEHLNLKGSPKIQDSSLGTLVSDQEIDLELKEQKVHRLTALGHTQLTSAQGHRLTTHGTIEMNGDQHKAIIHPAKADAPLQLQYEEDELSLSADEAQIDYREEGQTLRPEKVELAGHIKIFSREKEGPSSRGIADTVTYHPDTRSCILKAAPGKKVLFMRDKDQLRISANEVQITYNPVTHEQEIRGIGHVVLSLSPEEQNLLNQVFRHVPPSAS